VSLVSLLLGASAAAANVLGGLVVVSRRHWSDLLLKSFLALGAGFMLAAAFLKLLPASLTLAGGGAAPLILLGYFLVHFFEHTLAPHFHFGEEVHGDVMMNPAVGFSALLGLSIHTFFDGVSIASALLVSTPLGLLVFVAVALHKVPEGFTVASIALASGRGKRGAILASGVLGGATLLGVLLMNRFPAAVAQALPISTGVTLYVAATDLMPEVNEERGIRMALLVFLGVALYAGTDALLATLGM
jgi:ZIP family zinc transporter/zinc and cadmium transporter